MLDDSSLRRESGGPFQTRLLSVRDVRPSNPLLYTHRDLPLHHPSEVRPEGHTDPLSREVLRPVPP